MPPPSLPCRTHNADASSQPPTQPALLYSLPHLEEQLKVAYKLVTEGKFTEALKVCQWATAGSGHMLP
jgi:hypothetical protein